jgi:L-iditol 2-dehydrogenase
MTETSMNALVLHAVGDARHQSVRIPEPQRLEVRIRVGFCGVCGSDIPRFFGEGPHTLPLVCGHEFAGTIEKLGSSVDDFHIGDRVAVFPLLWCGNCGPCALGKFAQCLRYDYLGSRSDGAFAEFVTAPTLNLIRLPLHVSLEEAALVEPAAVALHALRRAGGCSVGECIAIFGAGPIGLMVAQWARTMGASVIIIFDLVPEKLSLARRLGFPNVFDAREQDPVQTVEHLTGGSGAHVCIEAAGVSHTTLQSLQAARRNGRVVLLGNPADDVLLSRKIISRLMRREVQILGTWNSEYSAAGNEDDWHDAITAIASGAIDVKPLISHKVKLRDAFEALKMLRDRKEYCCKMLIYTE